MASGDQVSSMTFFDLPLNDVIVPHIAQDLSDWDLLAMWKAVAKSQTYRDFIEGIIGGVKRHVTVSENFPDKELFPIAVRTCHQLRSIEINFYMLRQYWNKSLAQLVANNPLISEITISCGTWQRFLKIFTNTQLPLRRVTLKDVNWKDEAMSAFFEQQPLLRSIKLEFRSQGFLKGLLTIGRTCHDLEEMDMTKCSIVDNTTVRKIAENCPRLRTFLIPEIAMCLMRNGLMLVSVETLDLLLSRNITFCQEDDPILLELMERRLDP